MKKIKMRENITSVIRTQGLSKSYGDIKALNSLDLEVPKNSIFGFLGPNGAGKTTTIKLLLGLTRPTSGTGMVFGKDIVKDSVDIRTNIGYLPQDARFYDHMTARQTLDFTAKFFYKGPQSEIDKRVNEMLELVGLEDKADRPIKGFSGGERQRLGIAQAEVNYPDLLILDEPAASLDPQGRRDVLEVMSRIRKYATIFYCTHILDDVQRISDQVAILNHGKLITQAPIEELLNGTGDIIYSVTLREDAARITSQINDLNWVSRISSARKGDQFVLEISVSDPDAAEDQLLSLFVSNGLRVSDFGRKEQNLEDIFLSIVEGSEK
ncbi:MAG: ABC transporter ATP-binding protein [Anaerolineales bacterium]